MVALETPAMVLVERNDMIGEPETTILMIPIGYIKKNIDIYTGSRSDVEQYLCLVG